MGNGRSRLRITTGSRPRSQASIATGRSNKSCARGGKPGNRSGPPIVPGILRITSAGPSIRGFQTIKCRYGLRSAAMSAGRFQVAMLSMPNCPTGALSALRASNEALKKNATPASMPIALNMPVLKVSPPRFAPAPPPVVRYAGPMVNVRAQPTLAPAGVQRYSGPMVNVRAAPGGPQLIAPRANVNPCVNTG